MAISGLWSLLAGSRWRPRYLLSGSASPKVNEMLCCGLFILFAFFSMSAKGSDLLPWGPTDTALLPAYCKARAIDSQRSPEFKAWMQRLGPKFLGIHHYCAGINYINRYLRLVNDPKRGYYLSRAVPEIDYVVKDMPANFPLAGEIYVSRGYANRLMKNDAAAAGDFMKAIEHDPNQIRAYSYLGEIYAASGKKNKALELITIALKRAPNSITLQQKYLDYGGKPPFPEPVPIPAAEGQEGKMSAPQGESLAPSESHPNAAEESSQGDASPSSERSNRSA